MLRDDVDVLEILEKVAELADAQLWEIAHRCRVYRARQDGEDQTVEIRDAVMNWADNVINTFTWPADEGNQ